MDVDISKNIFFLIFEAIFMHWNSLHVGSMDWIQYNFDLYD